MNRDRDNVLISLDETEKGKLALSLKLYDFSVSLEEILSLLGEREAQNVIISQENLSRRYSNRDSISLLQVRKIFENKRETLRLVIFTDGHYTFLAKKSQFVQMSEFCSETDQFEIYNIQEGQWVCVFKSYWHNSYCIGCFTDAFTREKAEEWADLFLKIEDIRKNSTAHEIGNHPRIRSSGEVTIEMLSEDLKNLQEILKEVAKLEEEEEKKKEEALSKCTSITEDSTGKTTTVIQALDDHVYTIESPIHLWNSKDLECFVYQHRYNWDQRTEKNIKENTFFSEIFRMVQELKDQEWIHLRVDQRPSVTISFKTVHSERRNDSLACYLDSKRVAFDDLYQSLKIYFMDGQPLVSPETEKTPDEKIRQERKERDLAIVSHGIQGFITDLEGETPINIGFEKKENGWDLVIGEKRIRLKGGLETIKSLERVLSGKALAYDSRHSTEELFRRLSSVLGEKEAIEIITTAKELGKLLKALEIQDSKT